MKNIFFFLYLYIFKIYQFCSYNFFNFLREINKNEILIIEKYDFHGECIPGFIKYFQDLGYKNIDILINIKLNKLKPLNISFFDNKINIFEYSSQKIENFITLGMCNFYKICLFITLEFKKSDKIRLYLYNKHKFKKLIVFHELFNINKKDILYYNIIVLKKFQTNIPVYEVNPHFFGEYKFHNKSKITNFIIVGNIQLFRKNFLILFDSIEKLINNKINNFHITIIGGKIEKKIKILFNKAYLSKYVTFTGRIPYDIMYKYISKSDFLLPLLDPDQQSLYLSKKTSGSFQLVYGFNIPIIIQKIFAEKYEFNNSNSIIYDNNQDFFNKLNYSINMKNDEYIYLKKNLKKMKNNIEKKSINNLKLILNK